MRSSCQPAGFTLIEILIVIFIIGIVASFAILATGDFGFNRRVETSAQQFTQLVRLAEQQAVLQPAIIGIEVTSQGYRFYHYLQDSSGIYKWKLITNDPLLTFYAWPSGIYARLRVYNSSGPLIVITTTGDITPFEVNLMRNYKLQYQIIGTADGVVNVIKR